MDRLTVLILVRGVESLLAVALWKAYGQADSPAQLWALFVAHSELDQVGTITALVLIGRTLVAATRFIWSGSVKQGRKLRGALRAAQIAKVGKGLNEATDPSATSGELSISRNA